MYFPHSLHWNPEISGFQSHAVVEKHAFTSHFQLPLFISYVHNVPMTQYKCTNASAELAVRIKL